MPPKSLNLSSAHHLPGPAAVCAEEAGPAAVGGAVSAGLLRRPGLAAAMFHVTAPQYCSYAQEESVTPRHWVAGKLFSACMFGFCECA